MPAGLKVYNDQRTLQFDSDAPAYGFVGKGTWTLGNAGLTPTTYMDKAIGYVENLPTFDTYALSCTSGAIIPGSIGYNDQNSIFFTGTNSASVVTYYLFRSYSKLAPIPGLGFQSFSASGQLTYSTAYRPLAIVAKHNVTSMYQNMSEYRGLPALGRDYAFIGFGAMNRDMGNNASGSGDLPLFEPTGANAGARLSGNGYYVEEIRGDGYTWYNRVNGGFLIVDVTGL